MIEPACTKTLIRHCIVYFTCILLFNYLLIALNVFQGMLRSAFIASEDSVGICKHTSPWISSSSLTLTSGVEDPISCDI